MNRVEVKLPCECGRQVAAQACDAGGAIDCSCGRAVTVPNLSRLRTMAGQDAYVTNPAEPILKMQRSGQRPAGCTCLLCGSNAPRVYLCVATCESSHIKGVAEKNVNTILSWLAFVSLAFMAGLAFLRESRSTPIEIRGHDVGVSFDLPVCDACAATNGSPMRSSVAKGLMHRVPAYRKLLQHYPNLSLKISRAV